MFFLVLAGLGSGSKPLNARAEGDKSSQLARLDSLLFFVTSDSFATLVDPLITEARTSSDSMFLMGLLRLRGVKAVPVGELKIAEEFLEEDGQLATALDDSAAYRRGLRWLALAVGNQGRRQEGLDLSTELLDLSRESGDRFHEAWALLAISWHRHSQGRDEVAADGLRRALALFRETGDPGGEAWAQNGLGVALSNLGRYREAADCYRGALEKGRVAGDPLVEQLALNNLGGLEFSLGDPSAAMKIFRRAADLHEERGEKREAVSPLLNYALCLMNIGRDREAAEKLQELIARCEGEGYLGLLGPVLSKLGLLRERQARYREAAAIHRETLSLGELLPHDVRVTAYLGLSAALAGLDSTNAALDVLRRGDRLLRERPDAMLQMRLEDDWAQLLLKKGRCGDALERLRRSRQLADRAGLSFYQIRAHTLAAETFQCLGRPDSVAASLARASRVWEESRSVPLDREWREVRGSFGRRIYTALATHILENTIYGSEADRIRLAFDRLQKFKARTLLERMHGPGISVAEVTNRQKSQIVDLQALQEEVLHPGELLLDAYLGKSESIAFAVTRTEARMVRLPPEEELLPKLRLYHELLSTPGEPTGNPTDLEGLRSVARDLYRPILGGLEDLLAETECLFFAADGVLNLLPITEMPFDSDSGPGGICLIDRMAVIRIPSATILSSIRRKLDSDRSPKDARVLVLAGSEDSVGNVLAGVHSEAKNLHRRYRSVTIDLFPSRADGIVTPERLAGYDLLHVAAHTQLNDDAPWRSRIILDPRSGEGDLEAAQIAEYRFDARLAVLSSCETAGGRILSGEGVLGLSSAFLAAGVPAMVATLWPVDDRTTARFMDRFYEEIAEGRTTGSALRAAQRETAREGDTSHPFYWAGFVLIGDGEVRIDLERRVDRRWMVPVAAGLLVLAFAITLRRRQGTLAR